MNTTTDNPRAAWLALTPDERRRAAIRAIQTFGNGWGKNKTEAERYAILMGMHLQSGRQYPTPERSPFARLRAASRFLTPNTQPAGMDA